MNSSVWQNLSTKINFRLQTVWSKTWPHTSPSLKDHFLFIAFIWIKKVWLSSFNNIGKSFTLVIVQLKEERFNMMMQTFGSPGTGLYVNISVNYVIPCNILKDRWARYREGRHWKCTNKKSNNPQQWKTSYTPMMHHYHLYLQRADFSYLIISIWLSRGRVASN